MTTDISPHVYKSKECVRSRKAYVAQSAFEYFGTILVGDAFLAKLLSATGMKDSMIGIVSSLVSFAFLFQLLSIFAVKHIKNTKRVIVIFNTLSLLLFMGMYFVPFLPFDVNVKTVTVTAMKLAAYFCTYLVASILFKWANSFVNPANRAAFSAGKEIVSLLTGIAFTLIMGFIVDKFEEAGNLTGAFLVLAAVLFVLSVCDFVCLMLIGKRAPSDAVQTAASDVSYKDVMKNTFGNAQFRHVVVMTVLYNLALYTTTGFLGIYKTKDLLLSVGTVQLINIFANLARVVVSKPFGRFADRHSYTRALKIGYAISGLSFGINMFTTPKTWWFIILYTVLYNVSLAATNQNASNVIYSCVEPQYFSQALAIKNSICGVFGFTATLLSGRLLDAIQRDGNVFLGLHVYPQQVMSAGSFVLIGVTVVYAHFFVKDTKRIF